MSSSIFPGLMNKIKIFSYDWPRRDLIDSSHSFHMMVLLSSFGEDDVHCIICQITVFLRHCYSIFVKYSKVKYRSFWKKSYPVLSWKTGLLWPYNFTSEGFTEDILSISLTSIALLNSTLPRKLLIDAGSVGTITDISCATNLEKALCR